LASPYSAALEEYEALLEKEPNRYRAIAGAMTAVRESDDLEAARRHAEHLVEQTAEADSERESLQAARDKVAG